MNFELYTFTISSFVQTCYEDRGYVCSYTQ
jgi:hypothetical protein